MITKKITLKFIKSTKNKHVYGDEDSMIKSIYIERSDLPTKQPDTINLIVEFEG